MTKNFPTRYDEADLLTEALLKQAFKRAKSSVGEESPHYALGYIMSVMKRVAAQSPAALKELQSAVDFETTRSA